MSMYEVVIGGQFKVIVDVAADNRDVARDLAMKELREVEVDTGISFEVADVDVGSA